MKAEFEDKEKRFADLMDQYRDLQQQMTGNKVQTQELEEQVRISYFKYLIDDYFAHI